MKKCIKKSILFVFAMMSCFICGLTMIFNASIKNAYAESDITVSGAWTNNNDGSYTGSLGKYGLTSSTSDMTVTVTGKGMLSFNYQISEGALVVNYNNKEVLNSSTTSTTFVSGEIGLTSADSNVITFSVKRLSFTKAASTIVKDFAVDRSNVSPIENGSGTAEDPYLIKTENDLSGVNFSLGATYRLENDITLTSTFKPIGTSATPFSGVFLGNNHKISNINITGASHTAFFASTSGATISDLTFENITVVGGSYSSFLIGQSNKATTVSNVHITGNLSSTGTYVGGIVGYTSKDGVSASNITVSGSVTATYEKAISGGLSGSGGTFSSCVVYAKVSGVMTVGGLTGGYNASMSDTDKLLGSTNSSFTNCFVAGEVCLIGAHGNNYPYWGLINGYGAWTLFDLSNSGQRVNVNYTSSTAVDEIRIFGNNSTPDGIVVSPSQNGDVFSFTQDVELTKTYVGGKLNAQDLLSETDLTGITGNYGGFTVRFKMADGTYKYLSTLDRKNAKFQSNFNINLDNLTSYVDNFSNIEIDQTDRNNDTAVYTVKDGISVFGVAKVSNANDFEHLSWIINGAIPTTFKGGEFYNARSVVTIGIDFGADIDLTEPRYARKSDLALISEEEYLADPNAAIVLNLDENNDVIYEFYGLGKSEMYPYRGSLYGNDHILTVNMDFPESYLMGIIACSSENDTVIVVERLTINGIISGRYRVGVIGMNDNLERSSSLVFTDVVNNADISAVSQVGGFVGEAQGSASITLNNCVNNGDITATNGDAGGLVGVTTQHSSSAAITLNNVTNNGDVTATNVAAGFVATTASNVTIQGDNTNSGTISSTSNLEKQYVGTFKSSATYSAAENSSLNTVYTVDVGAANVDLVINGKEYTTDENGQVKINLENQETLDDVSLSIESPLSGEVVEFNPNGDTALVIPISFSLSTDNVYETTNDNWSLFGIIEFNDGSTREIALSINLTEEQLNSNQLVFVNVSLSSDEFVVPENTVVTLKRITSDVKDYVSSATSLKNKTSGTSSEFLNLAKSVKEKHDNLVSLFETFNVDKSDLQRFNSYIQENNVSNNQMNQYYDNIVVSSDMSEIKDLEVDYGTFSLTKNIYFTMVSGKSVTKEITYTFEKDYTLSVDAKTKGVEFKVGDVVTYSFNDDRTVKINKIDLLSVEFEKDAEYVFDNTAKSINLTLGVLQGDEIFYSLLYNGEKEAINPDEYTVTIEKISGNDSVYYNIPENYESGKFKINKIAVSIDVENQKQFVYNKTSQATTFSIVKENQTDYQITSEDYTLTYSSTDYSSQSKPVNAGTYTAKFVFGENFELVGSDEFVFTIAKKQITDIVFDNQLFYDGQSPNFNFENFVGIVEGDEIKVNSYTLFDKDGKATKAINFGSYTVQINSLDNSNYFVDGLIKSFAVNKANLTLQIGNLETEYGKDLILDEISVSVIDGIIYNNDDLNIVAKNLDNTNAGDHILKANYENDNYLITFIAGTYKITKKPLKIVYAENNFEYDSTNRISLLTPEITGVLEKDKSNFVFNLYKNSTLTDEFKNAGEYLLKLAENETTDNYEIQIKQKTYNISKYAITLCPKEIEKNYNQPITSKDFSVYNVILAGQDKLANIVHVEYEVFDGQTKVDISQTLNVGTYTIKLNLASRELFENYDISAETNTLVIEERETYIVANIDLEKYYDGQETIFSAKMFGDDNEEIVDAEFTYKYYLSKVETDKLLEVGIYSVEVVATAGDNNKSCSATFNYTIFNNKVSINLKNSNYVYDGKQFTPDFDYTMNSMVSLDNILSYKLLDENETEIKSFKNAGNYFVEFNLNNDNFSLTQKQFAVVISQKEVEIKVIDREINFNEEFDIQNSTFTILSGEILKDESLELNYSLENFNGNAGSYSLVATSGNKNYDVVVQNGTFLVKKRVVKASFSGKDSLEFNPLGQNELLSVELVNVVTENAVSVYYTNLNNQQTNSVFDAGTYFLKVKIQDTLNYVFEDEQTEISKQIIIDRKKMSLDILIESKTYDGKTCNFGGVKFENQLVEEDLYIVEYFSQSTIISSPKNAGDYMIKISEKDSKNYEFSNNTKNFKIDLREVTISPINSNYTYTRQDIKPQLILNNVVELDDVKVETLYVSNTNEFKSVGNYVIEVKGLSGIKSANYKLVSQANYFYSIISANASINIANNTFTFNNKQITKQMLGITFTGEIAVLETDYNLSVLPTNAGTFTIDLTSTNSGIVFDKSSFKVFVNQAIIDTVKFESKAFNFDNNYHSLEVSTLTTKEGVTLDANYSNNSFKDVGSYVVEVELSNPNYKTLKLTATLTISETKVSVQVSEKSNFVYNSNGQGREIIGFEALWFKDLIEFKYVGEDYDSDQKPKNAGEYTLVVSSKFKENLKLEKTEFNFVIDTKAITFANLSQKQATYSADYISYTPNITGVYATDEVVVNVLYNNKADLPINAETYEITFNGLSGKDSKNYHLESPESKSQLVINPLPVKVIAENKSSVYGEIEKELTYIAEPLLANDKYFGEIARESGKNVNSYVIHKGTLSAGGNYDIIFVNGIYSITQRQISNKTFTKNFTYNGLSQIPEVEFENILKTDLNAVKLAVTGDTVNVGKYNLQFVLLNTNYKLPQTTMFEISISQKQASDNILSLASYCKDYDGKTFEPIAIIDGDFAYTTSIMFENKLVEKICDSGTYEVTITLDERNYQGTKTFEFVVNKIDYTTDFIKNAKVEVSADTIYVKNLTRISVSTNGKDFVSGNKAENLVEDTEYEVFVKLHSSQNYNETIFSLGKFKTSKCAEKINEGVDEILESVVDANNLEKIKELLSDSTKVSGIEKEILNQENIQKLEQEYQEYIDQLNEEIYQVQPLSDIVDFKQIEKSLKFNFYLSCVGAGLILIKRKKNNDN